MADDLAAARVKTVRDHMALECVQDWDGVIATFQHPRYEMHGTGAVYDGDKEVRGYFDASRATFPDLKNEIIAVAADGDTVLVEFWLSGTHLGPLRANGKTYEPTGRSFRNRVSVELYGRSQTILSEPGANSKVAAMRLRSLGLA